MKDIHPYAVALGLGAFTGAVVIFTAGIGAAFGALLFGTATATLVVGLAFAMPALTRRMDKDEEKLSNLDGHKWGKTFCQMAGTLAAVAALSSAFKAVNGHDLEEPEAWTKTPAVQKDLEEVCKRPSIKSMTVEGSLDGKDFTFTCPKK